MKKIIKKCAGILLSLVIIWGICQKINYAIVTYDPWSRVLMKSYYEQESIDNVFFGSSHVYCDVNPEILDSLNGMNNFNMATPGQRWDDTYYLLKEVSEDYDIKHVYLECYYWDITERECWISKDKQMEVVDYIDDPVNYQRPWLITYEMKPSINSFRMLANSADKENTFETWIPFVRYRQNLFNWEQIEKNIDDKNSEDYMAGRYHAEQADIDGTPWTIDYQKKGFHYSEGGRLLDKEKIFAVNRDLIKYGIGEKSEGYFRKTIEYCQKNGIEVTLFVSPIYDLQLMSTGNYDNYVNELNSFAKEYDIDLYDFNLIKKDYLDIKHGELFMDVGHLNGKGSKIFTPVLWDVLNATKQENANKFYDSYEEKIKEEEPEIYGIYTEDLNPSTEVNADGSPIYTVRRYTIASNRPNMEYRIVRTIDNGDENVENPTQVLQEYNSNNYFDLPINDHGSIFIYGKYEDKDFEMAIAY